MGREASASMRGLKDQALERSRKEDRELKKIIEVYKGLVEMSKGRKCFGPSTRNIP